MKTLKERLDELKKDVANRIESGNFEVVKSTIANGYITLTSQFDGLNLSINVSRKYDTFFTSGVSEDELYTKGNKTPELMEIVNQFEVAACKLRMSELMNEYSELAKLNGEP